MSHELTIPETVLKLIQLEQVNQNGKFVPDDEQYFQKLERHAELLTHQSQGDMLGYVFFYCNNEKKSFSYITLIGTSQAARGKGIGLGLLQSVLTISKTRGFRSCRLEVRKENTTALRFYTHAGFLPIEDRGEKLLMQIDFQ